MSSAMLLLGKLFQTEKNRKGERNAGGGGQEEKGRGRERKRRKARLVLFWGSHFEFLSFPICWSQWFKLHWPDGATREHRQPSQDSPGARFWVFGDYWSSGGQRERIRGNVLTFDWKSNINLKSIEIIKDDAKVLVITYNVYCYCYLIVLFY